MQIKIQGKIGGASETFIILFGKGREEEKTAHLF